MAEEEQDGAVEEAAGSKKKKMIIMIAGGVIALAIVAGAGLYFTGFFDDAPVTVEADAAVTEGSTEKETDEAETDGEGAETATTLYQALTPPFMVNFSDGNIKVIKLGVSLMAKDDSVMDAVTLHDPVIRNNILMLLSAQDPEALKTAAGKAALQQAIKDEVNKVLSDRKVSSKVKEVFFTDLVMQ